MEDIVYLKSNVVPEPLFDQWYAWPHLISPATAAMNIEGRHLKIMNSYIQAPQIHQAAVKNPKMLGGPFMDYDENKAEDVKALKEQTIARQAHMLEFAKGVKALNELLMNEAKGYSLEPLYEKVPEVLKGYVELVYDLNNQPAFRFFEPLLYNSPFYDESNQSVRFYTIHEDERPFVLSTPRLSDDEGLHLPIPFKSEALDELYRMQREPNSYERIKLMMGVSEEQDDLFRSFFTTEPPEPFKRFSEEGVRTRYFGHACILVETKDVCILADPVISYGYNAEISRLTYTDLPDKIDYVLITHNHQDHILLETLLQLRHRIGQIVVPANGAGYLQDPNLKIMLNAIGFDNVIEMGELERVELPGCTITGLPFLGEHSDLNIKTKLCHHVKLDNFSILFAADSCNIEPRLYEHIHKFVGDIDVLFLGMECDGAPLSWLYGPLLSEQLPREMDYSRRLAGSNYERGLDLVDRFKPKELYIYAMGQEPWLNYIMAIKYTDESNPIMASNKLLEVCQNRGMIAERLFGQKDLEYIEAAAL